MEVPLKELISPIELIPVVIIIAMCYWIVWLSKRRAKLRAINQEMRELNNQLQGELEEYRIAWREFKTGIVDKMIREIRHSQYRPLAELHRMNRELEDLINYLDNWSIYFGTYSSNVRHRINELSRQAKRFGA